MASQLAGPQSTPSRPAAGILRQPRGATRKTAAQSAVMASDYAMAGSSSSGNNIHPAPEIQTNPKSESGHLKSISPGNASPAMRQWQPEQSSNDIHTAQRGWRSAVSSAWYAVTSPAGERSRRQSTATDDENETSTTTPLPRHTQDTSPSVVVAEEPPTSQRRRGRLQFSTREPWVFSWDAVKKRLLLASTGSPSSMENRSVSSETSDAVRAEAYVRNKAANNARALAENGKATKHAHIGGTQEIPHPDTYEDGDDWSIDELVVDAEYFDDDGNALLPTVVSGSDGRIGVVGISSSQHHEKMSNSVMDTNTAHSETAGSIVKGPTYQVIDGILTFFKGYLIPKCKYFFEPRFGDADKEDAYRKERWFNTKRSAWFGSCFLMINMILVLALATFTTLQERLCYYLIFPLFTVPLPILIAFDVPRRAPHLYSIFGSIACNVLGWAGIITIYLCDWFGGGTCSGNRFFNVQFYAAALPFLGLFALGVNRGWIALGQLIYWGLICGLTLPDYTPFIRTAIIYLLFSMFVQYLHYNHEKVDRRMYTLRTQLKISYRAQQKAQIAEKRANNSKKKFISYIFHEVRVPLNTAYLAFQNLQASDSFNHRDEDQMVEVYALESSLQQVQQVLNDVLDLQRMDAGRFESSTQPFHFHRAINALIAGLKVATTAKKIQLNVSLDERIDSLPQSVEYMGGKATFVIGDEIRLRQVLTNIASNAVKFCRSGREGVSVTTKLIWPNSTAQTLNSTLIDHEGKITEISALESEKKEISEKEEILLDDRTRTSQRDSTSNETDKTHLSESTKWRDDEITPDELKLGKYPPTETTVAASIRTSTPMPSSRPLNQRLPSVSGQQPDLEKGLTNPSLSEKIQAPLLSRRGTSSRSAGGGPNKGHNILSPQLGNRMHSSDSSSSSGQGNGGQARDCVIVRIEISDSGPGIRPSDMVDFRLFSPYVQTEVGRVQGGKGSGLGLAIVRAIVQLAQGRLGVKSNCNGSTFWLEFRYPIATQAEVQALQEPQTPMSAPSSLRPTRPPIKPYKEGESSYSQYSASRHEAVSSRSHPVTPLAERDRAFSDASGSHHAAVVASAGQVNALGQLPARRATPTGTAAEPLRKVSTTSTAPTASTSALDVCSPFTSENWTTPNATDRSVLPAMTLTSATPPTSSVTALASARSQSRHHSPHPSPPLSVGSGRSTRSASGPLSSQYFHPPHSPQGTYHSQPHPSHVDLPPPGMGVDSATSTANLPVASPVGEEAFTPATRTDLRKYGSFSEAAAAAHKKNDSPSRGTPLAGVDEGTDPIAEVLTSKSDRPNTASSAGKAQSPALTSSDRPLLAALIVDDDPLTRKLMSRMMARLGCTVQEAENGQMFLDILLGSEGSQSPSDGEVTTSTPPQYFDIVTLDNAMPVMTGEQAIRVLRAAGRNDFVVGATGNALKSDQMAYITAGVDHVLCKPISAKDIKSLLDKAARRRELNLASGEALPRASIGSTSRFNSSPRL